MKDCVTGGCNNSQIARLCYVVYVSETSVFHSVFNLKISCIQSVKILILARGALFYGMWANVSRWL